jgi:hypothetical protein
MTYTIYYKMDNISYTIIDTASRADTSRADSNTYNTTNNNSNIADFDINLYSLDEEMDIFRYNELYTVYMSCSVKSLLQIMNYYNIQRKRLLKEEIIILLINFELDFTNQEIVLKRIRLWENITELSADNYFKSFITFTV